MRVLGLERAAADAGSAAPSSREVVDASRKQPGGDAVRPKTADVPWLDLAAIADVTVVVGGRRVERSRGEWTAESPGEQLIEVRFHHPTSVGRVRVVSWEFEQSRTQEVTIWASMHRGEQHREVVRQRFTFSASGLTEDVEEYALRLEGVSALQLRIVPSVDGRAAVARVREVRVAPA
jgi:hypothetical protein